MVEIDLEENDPHLDLKMQLVCSVSVIDMDYK